MSGPANVGSDFYFMSKTVFLADIDFKGSPMVRATLRADTIGEYADIYKVDKKKLPPMELFTTDGKSFLIADGMHRYQALLFNKEKITVANVTKGGYEDALKFALQSNAAHGLRRSREDKRRCVQEAIKQWDKISNAQLAQICSVDDHTVKAVRDEMEKAGKVEAAPVRTAADGRKMASAKPKSLPAKPASPSTSEFRGAPKKLEEVDSNGTVLSAWALLYWHRTPEVKEMLNPLFELSRFLKRTQASEDLMYGEVNFSAAIGDLDKIITNLQTALPYAVCTQCQGQPKTQPKGECRMCKGRGLISRFRWNTVPAEIRKMMEKK